MQIVLWVAAAIVLAVALYVFMGRKKVQNDEEGFSRDEAYAWASREFRRFSSEDKIVDVIGDKDFDTYFLKLANGSVGMFRSKRGKGLSKLVRQGEYRLRALPEPNGLQVDFPESDFFSGNFYFETEQDAVDVSTWLLNGR